MRATAICAITLLILGAGCRNKPPQPVQIAATTDAAQPGLVQMLATTFERESGVKMNLRVVPEEDALKLARDGTVQVVVTTEPGATRSYGKIARLSGQFAVHDLALFGPKRDPARVRNATSASDALQRIEQKRSRFCSPVDLTFVEYREQQLWSAAGIDPNTVEQRSACHGDAVEALRNASNKQAYTLAERAAVSGTRIDIKVLLESGPGLHDDYTAILLEHTPRIRRDRDAEWFVQWLMSFQGRDAVQNYRLGGIQPFTVRDSQGTH